MTSTPLGRPGFALVAALVVALALVAAACGGSSGADSSQPPASGANASDSTKPTATEEPTAEPTMDPMGGPESSIPTSIEIEARDNVFDVQPSQAAPGTIQAPANSEFSVRLVNDGVLPHNIAFFTKQGGTVLADGANSNIILEGESTSITFKTPTPGTYYFQCTVHPLEMYGEFVVESGT